MKVVEYIFKSNGTYFGFIENGYLFSRDGQYLGWIEDKLVWDFNGQFRGEVKDFGGKKYILRNIFMISPLPRIPKLPPLSPLTPTPQMNIIPITLPINFKDAF